MKQTIPVLAVAVLFIAPASAFAECAWVLWQELPVQSNRWGLRYPYDPPAFQTKKECDEARRLADAIEVELLTDATKRGLPLPPRSWHVCLPDTVDPRGPKGGAR